MKTFKNQLKKILPVPLLKELYLIYNKARILTVDRILFPELNIPLNSFLVYRKGYPFRENKIDLEDLQEGEVKNHMKSWFSWTQEEFLLIFDRPCLIEPDHGWGIVQPNKLIYFSLGISRTLFQPKPSFFKFLFKRKTRYVHKAISLRDTGEQNYFHFYNDVLSKLFFLESHGIDVVGTPIIISLKLWEKEYFQAYYNNSPFLQSLKWIKQHTDYIRCGTVIFCKPLTHKIPLWNSILLPLQRPVTGKKQKIFLTRSRSRLRFIENSDKIEFICTRAGFAIVDTDQLSLNEQIDLFSGAFTIVGIHGAGLTNLVFRNDECSVLEIFPSLEQGYLPFHYIMLAKMKGFRYHAIIGEPGRTKYSGGFYLDPDKFEKAIKTLPI